MPNNGVFYGMLAAMRQDASLRQSDLRDEADLHRRARDVQGRRNSRVLGMVFPSLRRRS
jgi:hypothetical protein